MSWWSERGGYVRFDPDTGRAAIAADRPRMLRVDIPAVIGALLSRITLDKKPRSPRELSENISGRSTTYGSTVGRNGCLLVRAPAVDTGGMAARARADVAAAGARVAHRSIRVMAGLRWGTLRVRIALRFGGLLYCAAWISLQTSAAVRLAIQPAPDGSRGISWLRPALKRQGSIGIILACFVEALVEPNPNSDLGT